MTLIASLREFINTLFLQAGFVYAVFLTLRQRARGGTAASTTVSLPLSSLKLWVMLSSTQVLSCLGADAVPLFQEFRVIFVFIILFAPPSTQAETYDKMFSPLLDRVGSILGSLHRNDFLVRRLAMWSVRMLVGSAIVVMNYVERSGVMPPDAVKDVLGGLVFARRTLREVVAASPRESPPPREPVVVGRPSLWLKVTDAIADAAGTKPPPLQGNETVRRRVPTMSAIEVSDTTNPQKTKNKGKLYFA